MKIAIDLTSLADNFSGIERYAANIALNLVRCDERNSYTLVFKDEIHPFFADEIQRSNVKSLVVPSRGRGKLIFSQLILPHELKQLHIDLALFLAFPAPMLYFGASLSTIHDLSCWDCPETMTLKSRLLWRVLDGKAARSKIGVLTISEFSKSRIVDHYGIMPEKVRVIYCGIDSELFSTKPISHEKINEVRSKYKLPDNYILSLSTIEPRKNLSLLLKAWNELIEEKELDLDLVLAGRKGWKTNGILNLVSLESRNRVHFTGFVEDCDLATLYACSELFVFPSKYEGFGLPPAEAQSCGAKVLCSDIPSLREACGDGASYFIANDVSDMKNALVKLISNLTVATKMLPSDLYSWSGSAQILLAELDAMGSRQ